MGVSNSMFASSDARANLRRFATPILVLLGAALLCLGFFARFSLLSSRQLAVDEYYFYTSISYILDSGLPAFPSGGYYDRGILVQYLTASSILLLGDNYLALRLLMAICGLLAVVVAYHYARFFLPRPAAYAVAASIFLSSWQIEFSGFARMYAPFQLLTVSFLYSIHAAYVLCRRKMLYIPHLLLFVGYFVHELNLLLTPLLFLPFLLPSRDTLIPSWKAKGIFATVSAALLSIGLFLHRIPFRNLGVEVVVPENYQPLHTPFLRLPQFPYWAVFDDPMLNLFLLLGILVTLGLAMWFAAQRAPKLSTIHLLCALAAVAALAHSFVITGALLCVAFFRFDLRNHLKDRTLRLLLTLTACATVFWFSRAALDLMATSSSEVIARARVIRFAFLGWPDFYGGYWGYWVRELPGVSILLFLSLAFQLLTKAKDPLPRFLQHPMLVVLYVMLCFSLLYSMYGSTRYSFFVYPSILITIALTVDDVVTRLSKRLSLRHVSRWSAAGYLLLFGVSEDFNPSHLWAIRSDEATYRTGPYAGFSRVWYPRSDYESIAKFVHHSLQPGEDAPVVVVEQPPMSRYLDDLGVDYAIYYDRRGHRFGITQRGSIEIWSGRTLLSTLDDLRRYSEGARTMYLVMGVGEGDRLFEVPDVWPDSLLKAERVFLNRDRSIEVMRVTLD